MYQLLLCTCPNQKIAEALAKHLITEQLAACVNILPGITSVYAWQGQVETAQEHLLLIKSHSQLYAALEAAIKQLHPYEVPEVIALPIECGATDYLKWIDACLHIE
jgi:periplasmic divalent cation tolerance protein